MNDVVKYGNRNKQLAERWDKILNIEGYGRYFSRNGVFYAPSFMLSACKRQSNI